MKKSKKVPIRYVPRSLSRKDKKKQINMLKKSQKLYKNKKYYTRKPLASYKNKTSSHIKNLWNKQGCTKQGISKSYWMFSRSIKKNCTKR